MFTCSDATQQEIVHDIEEQKLDGLVVASCSPKLHTFTFRGVAERAGLNPYEYTQVNIREQCSWTHTDDKAGATRKAIRLVRAGIARTTPHLRRSSRSSWRRRPGALVIGGGIAGLRAAIGLAEVGLAVFLVEKEAELGGWVGGFGEMYPHGEERPRRWSTTSFGRCGSAPTSPSSRMPRSSPSPAASATTTPPSASARIPARRSRPRSAPIVVATGFDSYEPAEGELGYGIDGVLTLPEFKRLLDDSTGPLVHGGKPVRSIVYVYCVGSRRAPAATSTARASAAAPPCTLRSRSRTAARRSASTTCTATCARTGSTS